MTSRRLGLVPVFSILGVAAITAGAHYLLPAATRRTTSTTLYDPALGHAEPADHAALIAWILLAIVLAVVFAFGTRASQRPKGGRRWVAAVGASVAAMLVIASVTWTIDPRGLWSGITLAVLFAGMIGAVILIAITLAPGPFARAGTIVTTGLALAYAIPALVQLPNGIRDPYHYGFTSDEIVSVAAGHFPLSDYIPQYTNLLGFPIAPVLRLAPEKSELVVLAYLLLLQVVAIAIAVALPILLAGRRYLGPALIVACGPPLMTWGGNMSSATYFAALPIRAVLPATAILATYLALRKRQDMVLRRPARHLLVGAIAGIAALNNPDYGVPVLVTVLVVVFLAGRSLRARFASTGAVAVAALTVFAAYALIGALVGRPVHWSFWFAFQRVFGVEGYASIAMMPFGPHIAVVGLFVSASVLGFVLIVRSRTTTSSYAYRQGLLLALTGGWALLTLPYFAGRSLSATLISGYAYAVGLVVAVLLPLLHHSVRAIRAGVARDGTSASIGLAFGGLAVAAAVATMALVWAPSESLNTQLDKVSGRSQPLGQEIANVNALVSEPANARLRDLVDAGVVAQAVDMSGLLQLTTGFHSVSVASSPIYYAVSPYFIQVLCGAPWPASADYLLVTADVGDRIAGQQQCGAAFDLNAAERFSTGESAYVLLRHAPGST